MKFIKRIHQIRYGFLDLGHTIMQPDRTNDRQFIFLTTRSFYEAVNYGWTIQILHKNYEIVMNELLLKLGIVNTV